MHRNGDDEQPAAEWLIDDGFSPCPYRPAEIARLPLRLPSRPITREEFAGHLARGDRRQGQLLYRPNCPLCTACQPIRLNTGTFAPSRTHRRVFRHGENYFRTTIGPPTCTPDKVMLYNRHKVERGLMIGEDMIDSFGYEQFLVSTCADTIELTYHHDGDLVGLAVVDRASDALSAVYCFFDPDYGQHSPGTYSVLKLISLCREWQLRDLYLGLYVVACPAMAYKATFLPHERLINGVWQPFESARKHERERGLNSE